MANLDHLPDSLILKIIQYVDFSDRQTLSKINFHLKNLCYDMSLVRNTDVEGYYDLTDEMFKQYIQHTSCHIRFLNLSHSYWLSQRCLHSAIKKCSHLKELHVIQCNLKMDSLVSLLADLPHLQAFSFSIVSFTNIKKDVFTPVSHILKQLKRLHIFYNSRELVILTYIGEHETLLDYCENLEELTIGSAEMSIPELYRPVVTDPNRHLSFRGMRLSSNIHAGAQMLFYGTLAQLPNTKIHWQTLLMPNVNFAEFTKKSEFRDCLKSVGHLRNLDISGSMEHLADGSFQLSEATELRYLNVARTLVSCWHLTTLANCCRHLTSLNLFECDNILYKLMKQSKTLDVCGLSNLLSNCHHLRHLNIGGSHHHIDNHPDGGSIKMVFSKIKGLLSLAIPICLLCEWTWTSPVLRYTTTSGTGRVASACNRMNPAKRFCQDGSICCVANDSYVVMRTDNQKTVLEDIVDNNRNLRCLEIISVGFMSSIHKNKFVQPKQQQFEPCQQTRNVKDEAFLPIQQLKHLTSLTLIGAPGLKGNCLVEIAKNCDQLQKLSIGFLGAALTESHTFSKALEHMKYLKDLRIEQPYLLLNSALFVGLSHCCSLQRLCIIAKHSEYCSDDFIRLMDKLTHLVVLQLFTDGTLISSRALTNTLNKRFSKSRPALSVCINPVMDDRMKDVASYIPAKHFSELTRFSSRVCSLPPTSL